MSSANVLRTFFLDSLFLLKRKHNFCASTSFKLFPHDMKEGLFVKILERRKKGSSLSEMWQASEVCCAWCSPGKQEGGIWLMQQLACTATEALMFGWARPGLVWGWCSQLEQHFCHPQAESGRVQEQRASQCSAWPGRSCLRLLTAYWSSFKQQHRGRRRDF